MTILSVAEARAFIQQDEKYDGVIDIDVKEHDHVFFKIQLVYQDRRKNKAVYMCRQQVQLNAVTEVDKLAV